MSTNPKPIAHKRYLVGKLYEAFLLSRVRWGQKVSSRKEDQKCFNDRAYRIILVAGSDVAEQDG